MLLGVIAGVQERTTIYPDATCKRWWCPSNSEPAMEYEYSAKHGKSIYDIYIYIFEVHKDHHMMVCIGNKVNLHLFFTILIICF